MNIIEGLREVSCLTPVNLKPRTWIFTNKVTKHGDEINKI